MVKKKDEAIANPGTNSGPRYPYATVLWAGVNHRIVLDSTPSNAKDSSGGGKSYDTDPGGGVFQISGKDGSVLEMAGASGRITMRGTGQLHIAAGKGLSETIEGAADSRRKDERTQVQGGRVETTGGGSFSAAGDQHISTSGDVRTEGTPKDKHSVVKGDSVGSSDGNSFTQSRGDQVHMIKGTVVRVTEGEDAEFVISGNASKVYQKDFKIHVDGDATYYSGKKTTIQAVSDLTIKSDSKITISVGDTHIIITDSAIHIKAKDVRLGGGDKVQVKASSTLVNPDWVNGAEEPE